MVVYNLEIIISVVCLYDCELCNNIDVKVKQSYYSLNILLDNFYI